MNYFLLDGVIRSQNALEKSGEAVSSGVSSTATSSPGLFGTIPGIILYFVVIIAFFYFIAIMPQKKREKQLKNLQDEIKLGDWVLLDSGMYGKVAGISETVFTLEFGTNKSILIPVLKQRIVAKAEPNFSDIVQ